MFSRPQASGQVRCLVLISTQVHVVLINLIAIPHKLAVCQTKSHLSRGSGCNDIRSFASSILVKIDFGSDFEFWLLMRHSGKP